MLIPVFLDYLTQLVIILLFTLYFCLDTPMKVRLVCISKICRGSCSLIQKLCHLKDEKTSSSYGLGIILSFSFMSIYLSVLACPTDIHLHSLSIAVSFHYHFISSRKMAQLQPCIHHTLNPNSLLHLGVYFDVFFPASGLQRHLRTGGREKQEENE